MQSGTLILAAAGRVLLTAVVLLLAGRGRVAAVRAGEVRTVGLGSPAPTARLCHSRA